MTLVNRAQILLSSVCLSVLYALWLSYYTLTELTQTFTRWTFTHLAFIWYECSCKPKLEKFGIHTSKSRRLLHCTNSDSLLICQCTSRFCRRLICSTPGFLSGSCCRIMHILRQINHILSNSYKNVFFINFLCLWSIRFFPLHFPPPPPPL